MKTLGQAPRSYATSLQNTDIRSEPVPFFTASERKQELHHSPINSSQTNFTCTPHRWWLPIFPRAISMYLGMARYFPWMRCR